jgi:hypothetical protein
MQASLPSFSPASKKPTIAYGISRAMAAIRLKNGRDRIPHEERLTAACLNGMSPKGSSWLGTHKLESY